MVHKVSITNTFAYSAKVFFLNFILITQRGLILNYMLLLELDRYLLIYDIILSDMINCINILLILLTTICNSKYLGMLYTTAKQIQKGNMYFFHLKCRNGQIMAWNLSNVTAKVTYTEPTRNV